MDDAALLEAVAEGSQDAMAAVFDRYSRIVYCIALRVLKEPSLAEDVMQEVLLQVWKRPQSFVAQRGNLAAWLSVVARNRSIDVLRKRSPLDPLGDLPRHGIGKRADLAHRQGAGGTRDAARRAAGAA